MPRLSESPRDTQMGCRGTFLACLVLIWGLTACVETDCVHSDTFECSDYGVLLSLASFRNKPYFVATGDVGRIVISEDSGLSWVARTLPTANNLSGVATNGNGTWVAVGGTASGESYYSVDRGVSWSVASLPAGPTTRQDVTYGAGWFVSVGSGGQIYVSNDGMTWGAATSPTAVLLRSVEYLNGQFVAGSDTGPTIIRSTNGLSWQLATTPPAAPVFDIASDPQGRLVVCGNAVVKASFSTTAGDTWVDATVSPAQNVFGAGYLNGRLICAGLTGNVYTSTDGGANWGLAATGGTTINDVAYSATTAIGAGVGPGFTYRTTDAITWTVITAPTGALFNRISFLEERQFFLPL